MESNLENKQTSLKVLCGINKLETSSKKYTNFNSNVQMLESYL